MGKRFGVLRTCETSRELADALTRLALASRKDVSFTINGKPTPLLSSVGKAHTMAVSWENNTVPPPRSFGQERGEVLDPNKLNLVIGAILPRPDVADTPDD